MLFELNYLRKSSIREHKAGQPEHLRGWLFYESILVFQPLCDNINSIGIIIWMDKT